VHQLNGYKAASPGALYPLSTLNSQELQVVLNTFSTVVEPLLANYEDIMRKPLSDIQELFFWEQEKLLSDFRKYAPPELQDGLETRLQEFVKAHEYDTDMRVQGRKWRPPFQDQDQPLARWYPTATGHSGLTCAICTQAVPDHFRPGEDCLVCEYCGAVCVHKACIEPELRKVSKRCASATFRNKHRKRGQMWKDAGMKTLAIDGTRALVSILLRTGGGLCCSECAIPSNHKVKPEWPLPSVQLAWSPLSWSGPKNSQGDRHG